MPPTFLAGALIIVEDHASIYYMAWFGGHAIHAYTLTGEEVAVWNVGDFSNDHAQPEVIHESMLSNIKSGEYLTLMDRS